MESEHTANEQLANTPTERRASPEMVALATRNRAERESKQVRGRTRAMTALKIAAAVAAIAAAIFIANMEQTYSVRSPFEQRQYR